VACSTTMDMDNIFLPHTFNSLILPAFQLLLRALLVENIAFVSLLSQYWINGTVSNPSLWSFLHTEYFKHPYILPIQLLWKANSFCKVMLILQFPNI
jgi:hypothetical protein